MVTASNDKTARVWDAERADAGFHRARRPHRPGLECVVQSGRQAGGDGVFDKTARVWDLSGPTPVSTVLAGHTGPVLSASFSPDGKRVVTASSDKTARVWDAERADAGFHRARRPHRPGL